MVKKNAFFILITFIEKSLLDALQSTLFCRVRDFRYDITITLLHLMEHLFRIFSFRRLKPSMYQL